MKMDQQAAEAVGAWVVRARETLHGWGQRDLVERSGLSQATLSPLENGKKTGWSRATFTKIEDALQVERGTLARVANGEKVDPEKVRQTDELGQLLDQISRLADQVEDLDRRVRSLGA